MTNLFNALENCLQEIENGADLESILKQYPEFASELRPILKTARKAQQIQTSEPKPEAFWRGRAKVMGRAAELLSASQPIKRQSNLPLYSRLAISFALAFLFLLSGVGLFSASASALPGERLYPVKRGWEDVRLFLIFDQEARGLLQGEFENERLHEVNELLTQGRNANIQFVGIFVQVNGMNYVSGVVVILPANIKPPLSGEAVIINGQTNAQGFVEVSSLEILPNEAQAPLGNPIQIEVQTTPEVESQIIYFEIQGILQVVTTSSVVVNTQTLYLLDAEVIGELCIGADVKVKGYYAPDGRFIVTEIIGKELCNDANGTPFAPADDNSNSNNNENSNNNDNDDNSNDDNSNDDNSGGNSGSGGNDNNEEDNSNSNDND